ncbi:MAG: three component ABC system middle component [Clostridium butyricum]|nr:three component ABC system middle component [Clostridium butyricum]
MKSNIEYEIVQNSALGALAIWEFTKEYHNNANKTKGPLLLLSLLVLPIVFNKNAVDSLHNRHKSGGLLKALSEESTIFLGLQERMEQMCNQTFESINIAFSAGLLTINNETAELLSMRTSGSKKYNNDQVKDILITSKKLGYWLSELSLMQICKLLKVRF